MSTNRIGRRTRRRRLGTVIAAPVAALTGWAVIRLLGVDLVVSSAGGKVRGVDVIMAATLAALAAWAIVRALERRAQRPRQTWTLVGSTGLALSIVGPSWLAGGSAAVALIGLHVVTAAVVIAGFADTLPLRQFTGKVA